MFDAEGNEISPMDTSHQKFNLLERRIFNEHAEDLSFRLDFTKALDERDDGDLVSFFDEIKFGFAWNEMQFGREVMGSEYDGPAFDMSTK